MALITRCPACTTAFRVDEAQLRLRQGWVRCGVCNEVFDARTDLSEKTLDALMPPPVAPVAEKPPVRPDIEPWDNTPSAPLSVPLLYEDEPGLAPNRPVNVERLDLRPAPTLPSFDKAPTAPRPARTEPSFDAARFPYASAPILMDPAPRTVAPPEPMQVPPVPLASPGNPARGTSDRQEPQWGPDPIPIPPMRLAEPVSARVSFFNETGHELPVLRLDSPPAEPVMVGIGVDPLLGTPDTDELRFDTRPRRPLRWPWAVGVLLLLGLLLVQFAYVFRAQIATHVPETRPYLQELCSLMQCEVGHLTDAALLAIDSSSIEPWHAGAGLSASRSMLQAGGESPTEVDYDVKRRLALRVALRNRAPFEQPWPAMELSLTDAAETVVARRVLTPEQYLSAPATQAMMGAGSLNVLRVPIDTSAPQASGYRVLFFYP